MAAPYTFCDLTQSYSAQGGGIRTYLTEKRKFIATQTDDKHILIVPGSEDQVETEGRLTKVEIASPRVPGSPNYRLLLRNKAVKFALREHAPDSIECLDAYNLPWAALSYRKEKPETVLIAGYRTDFPTVYVEALTQKIVGKRGAAKLRDKAYGYAGNLYARFDGMYALNPNMAHRLERLSGRSVDVLPLGTDLDVFNPNQRDERLRLSFNVGPSDPLLIYVGRIDKEKQPDVVVDAFLELPETMNAHLIMLGDGNLRQELAQKTQGQNVHFPGYVTDRQELAKYLASSDLYVSAMAFETFGISIIEAQAAGLPIIGVAAGAMPDRVPLGTGILGPVDNPVIMADNIVTLWKDANYQAMREAARQHVVDHFSWERTFEHLFGAIYPKARDLRALPLSA